MMTGTGQHLATLGHAEALMGQDLRYSQAQGRPDNIMMGV